MAQTDNTQRNINDLMSAAKKKLAAQKEQAEREVAGQQQSPQQQPTGDVYAGLFNDTDNTDNGPDFDTPNPTILHAPEAGNNYSGMNVNREPDFDEYYNDVPNSLQDLETDVPVFEGGPGTAAVALWKKQFTKESVYHVKILSRHFIFRTLNRFEYKQIVSIENVDALYREEMICRTCVLWPYDYDFKVMALEDSGYPSTLAEIIMENSGFTKEYGIEVL